VQFDLIECWEDMASKHGSIISPTTFREFMKPQYEKIADFARSHGIEVILVDSDGNIMELAGLMCEAGVTAMYPFEVLAGNDVAAALAANPGLAAIGGLKKEAMAEGPEAVEREMEKAERLIRGGRFIPGPDHFVLSHTSWEQYRYFMERLREVVMSTPVDYP
jgi:uroporphyrinogen decarboxylase